MDLVSKDFMDEESEKRINLLSAVSEAILKERDRLLMSGVKPIDVKTLILFLASSFLSLISILKTVEDLRKDKILNLLINQTQPYLNETINFTHHLS